MISYSQTNLNEYLERLAAREPVPGGGSAAALAGALGAALISMSTRYSLGKGKPKLVEKKLESILLKAEAARLRLLELAGEDAQVYLDSVKAKKESPAAYRKALKKAAAVPREIVTLCAKTAALTPFLHQEGNKYLLSDVRAAETFLKAAVAAATIMIETNQ